MYLTLSIRPYESINKIYIFTEFGCGFLLNVRILNPKFYSDDDDNDKYTCIGDYVCSICRWHSNRPCCPALNLVQLPDFGLHKKWGLSASSRKKIVETSAEVELSDNEVVVKKKTPRKRATAPRTRKKPKADAPEEEDFDLEINNDALDDESAVSVSSADTTKTPRRTGRKCTHPLLFYECFV